MGCTAAKEKETKAGGEESTSQMKVTQTAAPAVKLDPKDFVSTKLKGELVIKKPGTLHGQDYRIEDCEDCDIFLLDVTAQVQIDACKNCRIFIAPCESSVFVRDCEDCALVVACQQYRVRDCKKLKSLLFVVGDAAFETSTGCTFGCFQYSYPGLKEQFATAKLSVHQNQWSKVHDFGKAMGQAGEWSFAKEEDSDPSSLLKCLCELSDVVSKEQEEAYKTSPVLPKTWGRRPPVTDENGRLALFWSAEAAEKFYGAVQMYNNEKEAPLLIVEGAEVVVSASKAESLAPSPAVAKAITGAGGVIGLEVCFDKPDSETAFNEVLSKAGLVVGESCYISPVEDSVHAVKTFLAMAQEPSNQGLPFTCPRKPK